ncbi:MAG: hypothetical protein Q4C10_11970 [Clostridia bacterium]|nr:hypothetical protein [Clostridia bacterium]
MERVFLIRYSNTLFEPVKKNGREFIVTDKNVACMDVVKLSSSHVRFSGYIIEEGAPVGVRLWCDYGHGYGFDKGTGFIEMRPGDGAHFSYEGTSIDDEGDPEDFSIDYYLELLKWEDDPV